MTGPATSRRYDVPAHVPVSDVQELWQQNHGRTWQGLFNVVKDHLNQSQGMSSPVVEMLFSGLR
jgi:hypothetical protein